jgi:DNA-binding XRE family transcriptional regulator/predicted RNase H-like HicB family nuclease
MEYIAHLAREGDATTIEFPDAPGCQTFAEKGEDVEAVAREALEGWLEAHLIDGDAPPARSERRPKVPKGASELLVRVSPPLALAVQIRQRRLERGLSQSQLGKLLGVSRQQAAALESPTANYRLSTLEKLAAALDLELDVEFAPKAAAVA